MPSSPLLSIVIVNWNVRGLLRDCLRSINEQMLMPGDRYEVIVVDNHSSDGSAEMVRQEFPSVTLIANDDNRGFGRANNQALPTCRGRYLLLLNPDTAVRDHAVDRMMERMESRPDAGALGCRLVNSDGSFQRWTGGSIPNIRNVACHFLLLNAVLPRWMLPRPLYLEHDPDEDAEVGWISGACMLLRREAIGDAIFDDRLFMYGEDIDLCARLQKQDWKIVYTPSAEITHHQGKSLMQHSSKEVRTGKIKAMRDVYLMQHGRSLVWLYDCLVVAGFSLRWLINGSIALVRRSSSFRNRAQASREYLGVAVRGMLRR